MKVRKSFRNFMLSRIAKSHRDKEFLDVGLMTSAGDLVYAHKFVLAGLSTLLFHALQSITHYDEDPVIIFPDFDKATLEAFVKLTYGLVDPSSVGEHRGRILDLCQLLGLVFPVVGTEEEEDLLGAKPNFVSVEDVERLFHDVESASTKVDPLPEVQPPTAKSIGGKLVLQCDDCYQKFSEEKDLAFHQQAAHKHPLVFFCAICRKSFEKETSLRHHKIAAHHSGTKVKLNCEKCGNKFTGKSALARHKANCDGKTSLDCTICGKVFARKDNLVNHMARHSGVSLKCGHCNKSFRTANDLYKHKKRLHAEVSGLKSAYTVSCEQCGRKFTDKGRAYKDHLDYHAGIKNYECHFCDKKFASAGSLRDHASQHTGLSTHACKICRKEFKRVQNIRQHLIWTHKISSDDNVRANIERLFLSGVDKLRALKEFEDGSKNELSDVVTAS